NGFAGTVNLAVTGLPAAVTTTFTPSAAVDGTTATINFAVAGTVPVGSYTGTLTSTATGATSPPVSFTLNVTAGVGGNSIVWQFCDPARIPVFFAVRDGNSGAWTPVTPTNNAYTFALSQATGGVAYVLPNGGGFATTVYLQAKTDFAALAASECTSNPGGGKTVSGSVTGLGPLETASVSLGGAATAGVSAGLPNFTLNNVLDGARDLVAARSTLNINTGASTLDRLIIRRGLNQAANTNITPLNFAAAESFAPVTSTITINNIGTDQAALIYQFMPATGGSANLGFLFGTTGLTRATVGVPLAQTAAGDLHFTTINAVNALTPTTARLAILYYRDASVNHAVTLGSVPDLPTVSGTVASGLFLPRVQGTIPADYNSFVSAGFTQTNKSVSITASRAYFATNQYDLQAPDLGGLSGFNATWGLAQNTNTSYSVSFYSGLASAPTDGTVILLGSRTGTTTSSQAIRK
ncbi:MAG: hypothetical protein ABJC26_18875, partial [Gemmatimonadaceae bacterium]